jgi:hypothetical protein
MTKRFRFPGRRSFGRKAQDESQLNWIFILIVGAVILAFFTFIVVKQRAASEAKFAGKVSQQLNTILVGAKVSSGTVQDIPTPELSIRFTCNDYYIGPASQRLGGRIVFAPEFLEGDRLITWTMDWNSPFKVTSFLYLTSPFVRYSIIGKSLDDPKTRNLFESLPQKLNKRFFSIEDYNAGTISEDGDKYVRFIFVDVGDSFNFPVGFDKVEISGLTVNTNSHQLQFLVKSSSGLITSGPKYTYIEPEVLYGGVFADKYDNYECIMKRAYSRLNMVSRVYLERLNEIAPVYDATNCEGFYRNNPNLDLLVKSTVNYPPDYPGVADAKVALEETNIKKLQLLSCPLIY